MKYIIEELIFRGKLLGKTEGRVALLYFETVV